MNKRERKYLNLLSEALLKITISTITVDSAGKLILFCQLKVRSRKSK